MDVAGDAILVCLCGVKTRQCPLRGWFHLPLDHSAGVLQRLTGSKGTNKGPRSIPCSYTNARIQQLAVQSGPD